MDNIYSELLEYLNGMEIVDTHEHLPPDDKHLTGDVLSVYFSAYLFEDLISAGLPFQDAKRLWDTELPLVERWRTAESYWKLMRNTGYAREAVYTIRELYGINDFSCDNIDELNRRFLKTRQPGIYGEVLHQKLKIETALLDSDLNADSRYFNSTVRMDCFIYPRNLEMFHTIENVTGLTVSSFEDWLEACERYLDDAIAKGARVIKSNLAYERSLNYERSSYHDAEAEFKDILLPLRYPVWDNEYIRTGKKLQDYMMHYILRLAQRRGMAVQLHTGLQAGNGNHIREADATQLTNLLLEYPDVNFGLMHISYPYHIQLTALAKCFPNAFIDMCWSHIISPNAALEALNEYLDAVPVNKIFAFGGDHHHIDAIVGHVHFMRRNLATALAGKVRNGCFDMDFAKFAARQMLYESPKKIYHMREE